MEKERKDRIVENRGSESGGKRMEEKWSSVIELQKIEGTKVEEKGREME